MSKHKNYTQEQKDLIVELHLDGLSSRAICRKLGISEKKKSSINYFLADWRLEEKSEDTKVDSGAVVPKMVSVEDNVSKEEFSLEEVPEQLLEELIKGDDKAYANLAKRLRTAQNTNNQLRKIHRGTVDPKGTGEVEKPFKEVLQEVSMSLNKAPKVSVQSKESVGGITAEVLISDIQYGKLMHHYNTEVAVKRVTYYGERVLSEIKKQQSEGKVFDKIVLAIIGDVIESDKKHLNSGRACDTGTAEQMKIALENMYYDLIEPLALLGVPMEIVAITGNHDHDGHGLNMYMPGSQHLSWPLYHSLRMITEAKGYDHVTYDIPDGCYVIKDICGFKTLYEHGVGVSTSEAAMTKRMTQRGEQTRTHVDYYRQGDKHNVTRFNLDTKVINGSFFGNGDDIGGGEYSAISGYSSEPAQLTLFHTKREKGDTRNSIIGSLLVQVGHIK